ncbi:hypothetical protein [uncultured Tenacibaculum sp.]|uniref:hypothetical protein n=1 Tax=uncultured Tenacibaculum sp. TaxID=174713 RepID=UPI002607512A|nr:hypothetical protein [uncultured Tenacibaculum sp.]
MKKSILNLGKKLNKQQQQDVTGGTVIPIGLGEAKCPTNPRLCLWRTMCVPCHL